VWDKVKAEQGNCLGRKCRYFDGCFYQASRRRIANGQLLICNHALFFSDLALKPGDAERASGAMRKPPSESLPDPGGACVAMERIHGSLGCV
jgi:Rad3-related DNA helicase